MRFGRESADLDADTVRSVFPDFNDVTHSAIKETESCRS